MTDQLPELDLALDIEALNSFFTTLTTLELQHVMDLGLDTENEGDVDLSEMFSVLGVMAARRLGHKKITKNDLAEVPISQISALISKASHTPPTLNQRTLDLLAELSGEGARP